MDSAEGVGVSVGVGVGVDIGVNAGDGDVIEAAEGEAVWFDTGSSIHPKHEADNQIITNIVPIFPVSIMI
jgi:hypothetical protein